MESCEITSFVLLLSEGGFCCYIKKKLISLLQFLQHALYRMLLASDNRKQLMEPQKKVGRGGGEGNPSEKTFSNSELTDLFICTKPQHLNFY